MELLSDNLNKLEKKINKRSDEYMEIENSLKFFIENIFPDLKFKEAIKEFRTQKKTLFIYTNHKLISQEFNLMLDKLKETLPKTIKEVIIK